MRPAHIIRILLTLLLTMAVPAASSVRTALADVSVPLVELPGSLAAAPNGRVLGPHAVGAPLSVTVVLQPSSTGQIDNLLSALYDPTSPQYEQWLPRGTFESMFAPSAVQVAQVQSYLQSQGLQILASPSPFLVRATGLTAQVEAAFGTHISDYVAPDNNPFFSNDTSVKVPATLSSIVGGVVGLSSTAQAHPQYITTRAAAQRRGVPVPQYGAGPGGSGLTPSQTTSIYGGSQTAGTSAAIPSEDLSAAGASGQGAGRILGLFELSGYTRQDVVNYEHTFFGAGENVPIVDVNVDGGPITPICPKGDSCGPFSSSCPTGCNSADYSGDIEVEADLETQIAVAPKIQAILVYNAPNDMTGQTEIDEYSTIARQDAADSISSSWGLCEQDAGAAQLLAESIAFKEMALQGQSMFSSAGDTGAFDCLRDTGSPNLTALAVDDPASQPHVTSVGGTSFGSFDPGKNATPSYPYGFETVWNPLDLCSGSTAGLSNCAYYGTGGGGNSLFWPRPSYQHGTNVTSSYTRYGPYCALATTGQACRETPDVSANADEFTPYAEYCTGSPSTNSTCATFSGAQTPPGWFGIGGTSLSSPLWSAIIALSDSFHGRRFGEANVSLYKLFRLSSTTYFHDITGINQTENNNGFYPVTPFYDEATGIGTPRIAAIVKASS